VKRKSLYVWLPSLAAGGLIRAEPGGADVAGKSVGRYNHPFIFFQGAHDNFLARARLNMGFNKLPVFFQFVKLWLRLGILLGNRAVKSVKDFGRQRRMRRKLHVSNLNQHRTFINISSDKYRINVGQLSYAKRKTMVSWIKNGWNLAGDWGGLNRGFAP